MTLIKKKILILGSIKGANRCQDLIENLRIIEEKEFFFKHFKKPSIKSKAVINKIYTFVSEKIFNFINIFDADVIIYLAMNNQNLFELRFGKILKKRIILDIYTLREDIISENRQYGTNKPSTKKILKYRKIDEVKIQNATDIIYVTIPEKQYIQDKHPEALKKKSYIVSNSQNKNMFISPSKEKEINFYNKNLIEKNEPLVVAWWGQCSLLHNFEYIFEEIYKVNQSKLILTIYDPNEIRVNALKQKHKLSLSLLKCLRFNTELTFDNFLSSELLKYTDVSLGVFGSTNLCTKVSPNKVFESALLGIQCITRNSSAYGNLGIEKFITSIIPQNNELTILLNSLIQQKKNKELPLRKISHWTGQEFGFNKKNVSDILEIDQ